MERYTRNCKTCKQPLGKCSPLKKYCSEKCRYNSSSKKEYYKHNKDDYYSVYYLPNEHYCGVTNHLVKRLSKHRNLGKDTDGWRILYACENRKEALYHEALFQSTLGIEGLKG